MGCFDIQRVAVNVECVKLLARGFTDPLIRRIKANTGKTATTTLNMARSTASAICIAKARSERYCIVVSPKQGQRGTV
jgi:hypothetical protein